jgi:hypothetical protein
MIDITGSYVEDLAERFDCDIFVTGATARWMEDHGFDTTHYLDAAAGNGATKWKLIGARPVLASGLGPHADKLLDAGWRAEVVRGRPIMFDTKGKGRRVAHFPGCEPVWIMWFPPAEARS